MTVKITPPAGSGFASAQGNDVVMFGLMKATVLDRGWTDKGIDVAVPDEHAVGDLSLPVTILDGNGTAIFNAGTFLEHPDPVAVMDRDQGAAGTAVRITITGNGFGDSKGTVTFNEQKATVPDGAWSSNSIDLTAPDLKSGLPVHAEVLVKNADNGSIYNAGIFTETPGATISPSKGVEGTPVLITGTALPAAQGNNKVLFTDKDAAKNNAQPATVTKWDGTGITVQAPDMYAEITKKKGQPEPEEIETDVAIVDSNNQPVSIVPNFTEIPPQWSDKDEKPFSIKFVGGYEQGYQSAQPSASDAFLAVYGRLLKNKDTFGPFYQIRLQTAPQASGTDGVVSVLTNPSGSVTSQNLQSVGSAVDMALGLEYQIPNRSHRGQNSLGFIAGGGFVTPLQTNSVSASYSMPAFGTVECTELQSRLGSVLSNPIYAGIKANTAVGSSSCYSNTSVLTASGPTNVTTLEYAAPSQPNFFPKYFAGLRTVTRFPGASGLRQCDENYPCERGYADFMLGQDASITGGSFKHLVTTVDSIYPLRVPSLPTLNFIYLFGSISERFYKLPPSQSPLVLSLPPTSGPNSPPQPPNPAVLVLPLTQPDRDFYRIGIGVSLDQIFDALKPKSAAP